MSSEFERLLREAGRRLPEPDVDVTRRARELAVRAVRRRSLRRPAALVLAAALVGLGVGIGALIAPSGTAAPSLTGLGFLPAHGWSVLQNGGDGTPVRPAVAIAANVELSPDDDPDGLPLSTLETLPPDGVVIVVSFIARGEPEQHYYDEYFPARKLPLRAGEATRGIEYGADVRPGRPLGQYQLRAAVNRHNVDVNIYFGADPPTPSMLADAQRQLDRMVIRPEPAQAVRGAPSAPAAIDPRRIVDRTVECSVAGGGGHPDPAPRFLDVSATPRLGGWPPSVNTWDVGFSNLGFSVGFRTGRSPQHTTGSVWVDRVECRATQSRVPLSTQGLRGVETRFGAHYRCEVPAKVLVRVRAVFTRPVTLLGQRGQLVARGTVTSGSVAVRTRAGKPIFLGSAVHSTGKARAFTARSCSRE